WNGILSGGEGGAALDGDVLHQPGACRRSVGPPQLQAVHSVVAAEEERALKLSGYTACSEITAAQGNGCDRMRAGLGSVAPPEPIEALPVVCEKYERVTDLGPWQRIRGG